jgi:hypothetical protein
MKHVACIGVYTHLVMTCYTDEKYMVRHQHKKLINVYCLQAVKFEVLTAVSLKIQVLWVMPC